MTPFTLLSIRPARGSIAQASRPLATRLQRTCDLPSTWQNKCLQRTCDRSLGKLHARIRHVVYQYLAARMHTAHCLPMPCCTHAYGTLFTNTLLHARIRHIVYQCLAARMHTFTNALLHACIRLPMPCWPMPCCAAFGTTPHAAPRPNQTTQEACEHGGRNALPVSNCAVNCTIQAAA